MTFAAACFICDRYVNGHGISLRLGYTAYSKTELPLKIGQLIGDNFMVVVSKDDELCVNCFNLINIADKLEEELLLVKKEISQFLGSKYELTVNEITLNNSIQGMFFRLITFSYFKNCITCFTYTIWLITLLFCFNFKYQAAFILINADHF